MDLQFEDESDSKVYIQWTQALFPVFGERMSDHSDLYEATHAHRIEHNGGYGEGDCTAWPSPPCQAPMWPLIAALVSAHSFLEVGCALGYNLALMASAGGRRSTVHGIEIDASHATLAEAAIASRGLAQRVRVFGGDSKEILPGLTGPYDVIFVDGGGHEDVWHDLRRLAGPEGVVVDREPLRAEVEKLVELLETTSLEGAEEIERVHAEVERRYEAAVRKGLVAL